MPSCERTLRTHLDFTSGHPDSSPPELGKLKWPGQTIRRLFVSSQAPENGQSIPDQLFSQVPTTEGPQVTGFLEEGLGGCRPSEAARANRRDHWLS